MSMNLNLGQIATSITPRNPYDNKKRSMIESMQSSRHHSRQITPVRAAELFYRNSFADDKSRRNGSFINIQK